MGTYRNDAEPILQVFCGDCTKKLHTFYERIRRKCFSCKKRDELRVVIGS